MELNLVYIYTCGVSFHSTSWGRQGPRLPDTDHERRGGDWGEGKKVDVYRRYRPGDCPENTKSVIYYLDIHRLCLDIYIIPFHIAFLFYPARPRPRPRLLPFPPSPPPTRPSRFSSGRPCLRLTSSLLYLRRPMTCRRNSRR